MTGTKGISQAELDTRRRELAYYYFESPPGGGGVTELAMLDRIIALEHELWKLNEPNQEAA